MSSTNANAESTSSGKVALTGITVKKEEDLAGWYQQVLTKGEMISYYDVSGCYIMKPSSWFIWKRIESFFGTRIAPMGVEECNFPLLISSANLHREEEHIEGFSAEVAWVTHGGGKKFETPLAIRPTSETAMYSYFAKEIQSYRDLPLRLNQWVNIVRWEFKHPMPFIRTREVQWQEGHTAHLTQKEAEAEVHQILDHYADVYKVLLAVPVIKGTKSINEQFPGAEYTTTVEAFIPASGRAIQAATSHFLGQHFSKMFNIVVENPSNRDPEKKKKPPIHVWQTSWGLSTRAIGVTILTHSDNRGLVLPPRVAKIQVIIIPVGITAKTSDENKRLLYDSIEDFGRVLQQQFRVRVRADLREGYSAGWKFNHWEVQGVPLRLEYGPREADAKVVTAVRREQEGTSHIPISEIGARVTALLDTIHDDLFARAEQELLRRKKTIVGWNSFIRALNAKNLCLVPHCLSGECEDEIKELSARKASATEPRDSRSPSAGAKSLCIPFEQISSFENSTMKCLNPKCQNRAQKWVLFGRSY